MSAATFEALLAGEAPEEFLASARPFTEMMMRYRCAMMEVRTKFEVLNTELSLDCEKNPIESISCRIKKPMSILEKLRRKGLEVSLESIEKNIYDVAGIRIICSFPRDIYVLAEKICYQDDIRLLEAKDYIRNPKPNGYRSLHLILEVPVFLSSGKRWMPVEVQLRTLAMDLWASIEHKVRYKKDLNQDDEAIAAELRECAEGIHEMDKRLQAISERIDRQNQSKKSAPPADACFFAETATWGRVQTNS